VLEDALLLGTYRGTTPKSSRIKPKVVCVRSVVRNWKKIGTSQNQDVAGATMRRAAARSWCERYSRSFSPEKAGSPRWHWSTPTFMR